MWCIYQCYEIDVQENTSNYEKVLTPKQKLQKLVTDIGGGWYMEKGIRDYHHWGEPN